MHANKYNIVCLLLRYLHLPNLNSVTIKLQKMNELNAKKKNQFTNNYFKL